MVYCLIDLKNEATNPDDMDTKDKLVLNGMTWESEDDNEYNSFGAFQRSESNTLGYYIF